MMALATTRPVLSQEAATTTAVPAVDQYDSVFQQLRHLAPSSARIATVRNLTLRRDVLTLVLEDGTLLEATPVAGRPVAAVFVGRGYLKFTPPLPMEQTEMKRLLGDSALATIISAVTFVCTDSTLAELERSLRFTAGAVPAGAEAAVRDAADWLLDGHTHEVAVPHLMGALLNGEASGFFYAHIKQEHGEDLAFAIDPREADGVVLLRHGRERGERVQLVSEFPRAADLSDSAAQRSGDRDPLMVESYRIDATIAKGLGFAATVTLRLTARSDAGPWARLLLFRELHVDSLRGDTGVVTTFHRSPDGSELWVRFVPARLA